MGEQVLEVSLATSSGWQSGLGPPLGWGSQQVPSFPESSSLSLQWEIGLDKVTLCVFAAVVKYHRWGPKQRIISQWGG